jgi:hypothetical protein
VKPVVNKYVPGWEGRVWKLASGKSTPTLNNELACGVGPNPYNDSLSVSFASATIACTTADQSIQATVTLAAGYTCGLNLTIGRYTGECVLAAAMVHCSDRHWASVAEIHRLSMLTRNHNLVLVIQGDVIC